MRKRYQSGAVSLFLVVFATLLITVVTVSFLRTMIQDQLQATNLDLSQSAYDSAQAGVNDAERALLRYMTACSQSASDCSNLTGQLASWATTCNKAVSDVVDTSGPDVKIQQSASGQNLEQAYTCVKVDLNTDDVVGSLNADQNKMIALTGSNNFDTVEIDWYTQEDMGTTAKTVSVAAPTSPLPLLSNSIANPNWKTTKPSLMRVQLIQYGANGFTLSDLDGPNGSDSNTNTVFLYPTCRVTGQPAPNDCDGTPSTAPFSYDARIDATGQPLGANCVSTMNSSEYACSEKLTLPNPIGGGARTAFLNIQPMYNATHFQVKLLNNGTDAVQFSGVQPAIDSTGRANDVYRRIETRVDLANSSFAFPTAELSITGSFCKNFAITNNPADYQTIGTACTP